MVQLFMTHFVEVKRWQDMRESKSQGEKGSFFGLESTFAGSGETGGYPLALQARRNISNQGDSPDRVYALPLMIQMEGLSSIL
jgi:hypothetical protein